MRLLANRQCVCASVYAHIPHNSHTHTPIYWRAVVRIGRLIKSTAHFAFGRQQSVRMTVRVDGRVNAVPVCSCTFANGMICAHGERACAANYIAGRFMCNSNGGRCPRRRQRVIACIFRVSLVVNVGTKRVTYAPFASCQLAVWPSLPLVTERLSALIYRWK